MKRELHFYDINTKGMAGVNGVLSRSVKTTKSIYPVFRDISEENKIWKLFWIKNSDFMGLFSIKIFSNYGKFSFHIKAYSRLHMLLPLASSQVILKCHCAKFRGEKFIIVGLDMHIYRPLLHCYLVLISRRSLQNAKTPLS